MSQCGECKALERACPSADVSNSESTPSLKSLKFALEIAENQFAVKKMILKETREQLKIMREDRDEYQQKLQSSQKEVMRMRQELLELHASEKRRLMGLPKRSPWETLEASEHDHESFSEPSEEHEDCSEQSRLRAASDACIRGSLECNPTFQDAIDEASAGKGASFSRWKDER